MGNEASKISSNGVELDKCVTHLSVTVIQDCLAPTVTTAICRVPKHRLGKGDSTNTVTVRLLLTYVTSFINESGVSAFWHSETDRCIFYNSNEETSLI